MTPLSRLRILVTEDEPDTRDLLELILTAEGCEVTTRDDPQQALTLAQTRAFDLYLLDNWMSNFSGIELCRKLRVFDRTTPIIFYSGAAYESDKTDAFDAGAQGYIVKPATPDELVSEITRLTSR